MAHGFFSAEKVLLTAAPRAPHGFRAFVADYGLAPPAGGPPLTQVRCGWAAWYPTVDCGCARDGPCLQLQPLPMLSPLIWLGVWQSCRRQGQCACAALWLLSVGSHGR